MGKSVGLRTEILLTLSLLMGAALLFGGVMLLRLTEKSLLEQRLVQLDALTQTLMMAAKQSEDDKNSKLEELLRGLPEELATKGWWLYNNNLELQVSEAEATISPFPVATLRRVQLDKESYHRLIFPSLIGLFRFSEPSVHYALPLFKNGLFLGVIELQFALDDIRYQLLFSQKMIFLYVFLYGSVLVLIGYYLLQRNVIIPTRKLLFATGEVGRGVLDGYLEPEGPLEIFKLAEAYNSMIDALRISRQETQEQIDALGESNQSLLQAREELFQSEKLASVGQLAAGLAHELGNPLAALIGYLELLKFRLGSNAEADIVSRSIAEAERIDFLIRELLDFSRPSTVETENLDPVQELRSTVDMLRHQGSLNSIEIVDEMPSSVSLIEVNGHKLRQVYINLLLNAVQACGDHGEIRLTAEAGNSSILLSIKDNGCGICEVDLPKIFVPFYTTKDAGKGTGLGLAVCYRIIEDAGGKITVSSELYKGTSFEIELFHR